MSSWYREACYLAVSPICCLLFGALLLLLLKENTLSHFLSLPGKKKTNEHNHFRRDGVRDKQELSLGQMGPLGQNGTRPWDKPAFLCLIPQ